MTTQVKNKVVYLLAATKRVAEDVARKENLLFNEWRYIYDEHNVRGVRDITVWLCPGYRQRKDLDRLMIEIRVRNPTFVHKS